MSVQSAINELSALCQQAGREADVREVASTAYTQSACTQAALSAVVKMLKANGFLPDAVWDRTLEAAYADQVQQIRQASSGIILPPGGKA